MEIHIDPERVAEAERKVIEAAKAYCDRRHRQQQVEGAQVALRAVCGGGR